LDAVVVEGPHDDGQFLVAPRFDTDGVQAASGIGVDGKEYPDPVPMAIPVGYERPPDIMDMIRSLVRSEALRTAADKEEVDTFEEAEDFDIPDDPIDRLTEFEKVFEPPASPPAAAAASAAAPVSSTLELPVSSIEDSKILGEKAPTGQPVQSQSPADGSVHK